jgi:hypothetical protein
MQNAIRSACREGKNKHEGEEELPGAGEAVACCASGGAVAEVDGGVLAHGRRLQAKALLSQAAERGILPLSFSSVSSPLLLLLHFLFLLLCFFLISSPVSSFSFPSSWVS